MAATWLACADREQAAQAVADLIAKTLRDTLAAQQRARLVVSGGTTPGRSFELLSRATLDWSRVDVLPSDERCVRQDHADSNAGLIRRSLLQGAAASAQLVPLFDPQSPDLPELGGYRPFSCVLLGMGADGHFASLFPDFDGLASALDPANTVALLEVRTQASPHPRRSLTLAALADAASTVLLFFGADKRAVYEAALAGAGEYPVASLLQLPALNLTTVWAP
jgi:6-phosphogluconolactonase